MLLQTLLFHVTSARKSLKIPNGAFIPDAADSFEIEHVHQLNSALTQSEKTLLKSTKLEVALAPAKLSSVSPNLSEKTPLLKCTKLEEAFAHAKLSLVSLHQSERTPLPQNSVSFSKLTKATLSSISNLNNAPCLI